jgi:sterol desaturase/sphingolipid hydroxylase (fatty acid hydroxylase superfamily)
MWINAILGYWLQSAWPIAVLMATATHIAIYGVGAGIGEFLTVRLWPALKFGRPLDDHAPKPGQVQAEIRRGLITCLVFGVMTLLYRPLCAGYWPTSWAQGSLQFLAFSAFSNIYTYGTHRLSHSRAFLRYHKVHHRSVRVTPWSGYSVHPLEAAVIGATLPIFMLFVPIGIGTAFALHAVGMLYTTCIHCNYELAPSYPSGRWFKRLIDDPAFHRRHHMLGNINYGFPSRLMDRLFDTARE